MLVAQGASRLRLAIVVNVTFIGRHGFRRCGPRHELNGPTMMARIGVMRALNRHLVRRTFNPDRKDTHWGKRKLKRDQ
jgi:hypothetical protein